MARMNFGGVEETVVTREEFPLAKARKALKDEVIAVLGYGVQGPAQSLNMRDNGIPVIIGQRKADKFYWDKALRDGWKPGKTLFDIEEAAERGTIIQYLVSDAAQMMLWPNIKPFMTAGKALYFSHGFSIVYKKQTKVIPPKDIDVILVAPKGSGTSVRRNFLDGSGINSSFAVHQDATGRALERTLALGDRDRVGLPVPDDLREGSLQRPHRRARRAHGLPGRGDGGAVQRAAQARPRAERGVQRDGRGAHAEPDPAGRRERHGLDVRQ